MEYMENFFVMINFVNTALGRFFFGAVREVILPIAACLNEIRLGFGNS